MNANVKKGKVLGEVACLCVFSLFVVLLSGCGTWQKAGKNASLFSLEVKVLDSGDEGTETFFGDSKTANEVSSCFAERINGAKAQAEQAELAKDRQEKTHELNSRMLSEGLVKTKEDFLD